MRPARAVRPARRSSPSSSGAEGTGTTVAGSGRPSRTVTTSVATIRSPGFRSGARPAAVPVMAIIRNESASIRAARSAARAGP